MYQIDFSKPCHVHFIGIGGISMSGLAEILITAGFKVSGSDAHESELTDHLANMGAEISIGQRAENIGQPDVVVYTAAIRPDNPEYAEAVRKGIPMMPRADLLGELMLNYRQSVNVSGTHGKTTTTSMITEILLAAEADPTVTVGGILDSIGGNIRVGGPDVFVAEACEYTNSFLSFFPTVSIVLNVEADHLDFFKDIDDIRNSFRKFIMRLPQDEKGFLIINGRIKDLDFFTDGLGCSYVTYGIGDGFDYCAKDISFNETAQPEYTLVVNGEECGRIALGVRGEHNVENSLAAIAAADRLGIDRSFTVSALKAFTGTRRRFEYKGSCNGFTVIDDYAHHPQEITATLKAALMYPHKKLVVAFQPHTYSRTAALLPEFAKALSAADRVILADIYAAREKNTYGISSEDLGREIIRLGTEADYFGSFDEIRKNILETLEPGDLLITMGAGNIVDIGNQLVQ